MELYYMPKLASVGQTLYQAAPRHAQWLYDTGKKTAFKVASPLGLMCRIEAMEECIARKSYELWGEVSARQPSATPTRDASQSIPPVAARDDHAGGMCHYQSPLTTEYRRSATLRSFIGEGATTSPDET